MGTQKRQPVRLTGPAIYVTSRVKHAAHWRTLRNAGYRIISTWIDEAGPGETADLGELWRRIGDEVLRCDFLLFYARSEDFPLKGALVEVGMALTLGKPVVVCLPGVELDDALRPVGSWIAHPLCDRENRLEEALRWTRPPE